MYFKFSALFSYISQVETLLKTQFTDLLENGTKN